MGQPAGRGQQERDSGAMSGSGHGLFRSGATLASPSVSFGYLFALTVALLAIVLIIVLYLGLVALVGWGTWWHAVHDLWWLTPSSSGTSVGPSIGGRRFGLLMMLLRVVGYVTPILAGGAVLFLLLKPVIFRRMADSWPVPITAEEQPHFVAAVHAVAQLLGAPVPTVIQVDGFANASAGFDRGDLVLKVGLPLVTGLSARDLLGVVAHELGHFRQGTGVRISWWFRFLVQWMRSAVSRRDALDAALDEAMESESLWIILPAVMMRLCVALVRMALSVLVHVGFAILSWVSRHLEYDADRAQIAIAGSASMANSLRRMAWLDAADDAARRRVLAALGQRQLPDNVIALAASELSRMEAKEGAEKRIAFEAALEKERTGIFDSHPSFRDRIAHAQRIGGDGVVAADWAAVRLFRNVEALSKVVTIAEYRERLGRRVDAATFVPVAGVVASAKADDKAIEIAERYFGTELSPWRSLPFFDGHLRPVSDVSAAIDHLSRVRVEHMASVKGIASYARDYEKARALRSAAEAGGRLLRAGMRFTTMSEGVEPSLRSIAEARERAQSQTDRTVEHLERAESLGVERMVLGLRLLLHPSMHAKLRHEVHLDVERMIASVKLYAIPLASLCLAHDQWARVAEEGRVLAAMAEHFGHEATDQKVRGVMASLTELHRGLASLRETLQGIDSPFPAGRDKGDSIDRPRTPSLGELLLPRLPPPTDPGGLLRAAATALRRLDEMRGRLVGRLIWIVLKVEGGAFGNASARTIQPDPTRSPPDPSTGDVA